MWRALVALRACALVWWRTLDYSTALSKSFFFIMRVKRYAWLQFKRCRILVYNIVLCFRISARLTIQTSLRLFFGFSEFFSFFGSEYEGLVATVSREQATEEIKAPSGIFRVFKSGCRHLLTRNTPSFLGRQIFLVRCASLLIGSVK